MFLELGGFRGEYEGAEAHDLVLRLVAAGTPVAHVDRLLYHGREGSGAAGRTAIDAGRRAVADYACRIGLDAIVEHGLAPGTYRVRPRVPPGRVSLNILTGGMAGRIGGRREVYIENFIRSIAHFGTDPGIDLEIRVIVDAGAHDAAASLPLLDERVTLVAYDRGEAPFNFAHKANAAVRGADAERIVLLNDDMEALDGEWLGALLEVLEIPGVGVAGGRLLYPDDTVQHCGIALGVLGAGAHVLVNLPKQASGYNLFGHVIRNYSAVTGACMAFRKSVFETVGGFDESYPLDFNDVDFCLKVGEAGWRVVYTPFAALRHFESRSAKRMAFDVLDEHRLMRRWEPMIRRDPFYNVNLRRDSQHFRALGEA